MIGNILIVDDDSDALKLLKDILSSEGHVVRPFTNGQLALRSIECEAPELVVLDIRMPGLSGFEVCQRIKEDERWKEIPVIFISAASDLEDKVRAFKEGGVDYISKPFQKEEVIARVKTYIELSHSILRMKKTTVALRMREQSMKIAQEVAHLGHWEMNLHTGEMVWSDEIYRIFGLDPQSTTPSYEVFLKAVHPDDSERLAIHIKKIRQEGDSDIAYRIVLSDGRVRDVYGRAVLLNTAEIVGVLQDITERKLTERALLRSEDKLVRAQAVAQIGSWHLDIITGRLEWTDESFRIFGIPKRDGVDLDTFFSTVHPDDREMVLKSWNEAIAGAPYDIEHRVVVDGEVRWVRERAVIEWDSDGRAISGIGTTQDITERLQKDAELRRLERMYRSLTENLPDIVSRFDRKLRRIYANPELARSTGMPIEFLLGKTHAELGVPDRMAKIWRDVLQQVFSTGESAVFEFEFPDVAGAVKCYQARAVPEYDVSGYVGTVLTIARDISTLKNVEAVLRESEGRFHAIASNVPGMVLQCCRRAGEGRLWFTYVSNGAKDLLNIAPEAILLDENEFIGRIDVKHARTFHDSMVQSQSELTLWNWEGSITAADGCVKWINLRATPHPHGEDACMWDGVVINVTESKTNENKLIHTQNMLRELAAHLEGVREEERKRVAREIHDELGQTLTALKMDVSLARLGFGDANPQLMKRLQSMSQLVGRTIEISRHITSSLRPGALDLGITAALEWLMEEFIGYTGIPCELILSDCEIKLNESEKIAVFRIVQESLTNIARHAQATQAEIIVTRISNRLCFEVCDNGKGFDLHSVANQKSFGLVGIRERMAILGGDLTLSSEPGQGTRVRVFFPVVS